MSNQFGISGYSYDLLIRYFQSNSKVEKVVIFGSRAKGCYKTGSDIDLAIYGRDITASDVMDVSSTLNEELPIPYRVDVVCPTLLNDEALVEHVERVGITFYSRFDAVSYGKSIIE